MLSVNSSQLRVLLMRLLCCLWLCSTYGDGLQVAWSEDNFEQQSVGGARQSVEIETAKSGRSNNAVDQLSAEVSQLRQEVSRLREVIERQMLQSEGSTKETHSPLKDKGPRSVMLHFHAKWCGPSQQVNPVVDRLKRDGFPIRSVDVDEEAGLMKQYDVESIPFFLMVIDGKEADHVDGAVSESRLREMLNLHQVRRERVRGLKWHRGEVSDRSLDSLAPSGGIVSDTETWKVLCKAWKLDDEVIDINFDRQFIVVMTTGGSGVSVEFERDSDGNLQGQTSYTADLRNDGFRYVFAVINRAGINSVNGMKLPAIQTYATD